MSCVRWHKFSLITLYQINFCYVCLWVCSLAFKFDIRLTPSISVFKRCLEYFWLVFCPSCVKLVLYFFPFMCTMNNVRRFNSFPVLLGRWLRLLHFWMLTVNPLKFHRFYKTGVTFGRKHPAWVHNNWYKARIEAMPAWG